jgi:predicted ATP-grasp superfamily ATP-dependent carboligase
MADMPPGVLLVDAGERAAVAACESLARSGYRVGTASSQSPAPAEWSRFSERRFRLPNPRLDPQGFAGLVGQIMSANAYQAMLPCSEGALWAVSSRRDLITGDDLTLGLPEKEVVSACTSKAQLLERAKDAGLSAPETVVCADREQALAAAERLGFPVILKPRRTVFSEDGSTNHLASAFVADAKALDGKLEAGWPCLLQRREEGQIVSFGGVMVEGRLLAHVCSRYWRTFPAEAGPVCFARSIQAPASLVDSVTRLVDSMGWQGIFELELIERGGGDFAVLDFNPRVYGSLALGARAGASLPVVWCDWLLKGRQAHAQARPGVFYRWTDADLRYAIWGLKRRRFRLAAAALRPRARVAHPYFRWHDPMPAAVRAFRIARAILRAMWGRAARRGGADHG